jgi:hypothetical protein
LGWAFPHPEPGPAGVPPAHLLHHQDAPDLAAAHGDAGVPGYLAQGIQRPLRRAALPLSRQLPGPVALQPRRRLRPGQRDDGRSASVIRRLRPAPGGPRARRCRR